MAAELARHGVRSRIIDRLKTPSTYCRAVGVTPRTLEVWEDIGIAGAALDSGLWLTGMRLIVDDAPPKDLLQSFPELPYGFFGLPQYETERILGEHLSRCGIDVERPTALSSLVPENGGVRVTLERGDASREEAVFRYVVGCDGAHSPVRRSLGIPFNGDRFPSEFMLGDVRIDWDLPRGLALRAVRTRTDAAPEMFIAIPLPERNRYRVSMLAPEPGIVAEAGPAAPAVIPESHEHGVQSERPGPKLEELQEVANRLLPDKPRLTDLRWSSIFRISMRLAERYRNGNAFIAGDAAHIHPPTGGQGMNTGIQDAYNLAWKMALVINRGADPSLLDSYEEERRPVGEDVVTRTRVQSEEMGRREGKEGRLIDTQLLVNYRGRTLSRDLLEIAAPDGAPHAGDRAPDCDGLQMDNVRSPLRMFDILRGTRFVLAIYYGDRLTDERTAFIEGLAARLRISFRSLVKIVAIVSGEGSFPALAGATVLRDTAGEFQSVYSAKPETGYLFRPDGYVGLHLRPVSEDSILNYLRQVGLLSPGH